MHPATTTPSVSSGDYLPLNALSMCSGSTLMINHIKQAFPEDAEP